MVYKGFEAKVTFDEDAGIFHGEVINTKDVITFQGTSVKELEQALKDSVEDYREFCAKRGEDAEKPVSGRFLMRLPPELHRKAATRARREGISLNAYVVEAIKQRTAAGK